MGIPKIPPETTELAQVDRADDVDDLQLVSFGVDDEDPANLAAGLNSQISQFPVAVPALSSLTTTLVQPGDDSLRIGLTSSIE